MKAKVCAATALLAATAAWGDGLDDIRAALEQSSVERIQEKVYVHTDNMCYFIGDTVWYKAYVVRADDLCPTDMSRVLYVELLSPDGFVVERQQIIVSGSGYSCGNIALTDSLYSGYYELRAYTRWMLNFNVEGHPYKTRDTYNFYNKQMAADYFREWPGLYSRVFPVYLKPDSAGDYSVKRIANRPKQRLAEKTHDELHCAFFPEGGHLVAGVNCRVAFELTDEKGAAVDIKGSVTAGSNTIPIAAEYMGRGTFDITPDGEDMRATFTYKGKSYSFDLPNAEETGATLRLNDGVADIRTHGIPAGDYGLSVLCRGALQRFDRVTIDNTGHAAVNIPDSLYAGVHDLTLFDSNGQILADRLFFVYPTARDTARLSLQGDYKSDYAPYEHVDISLTCNGVNAPSLLSVSVRDGAYDDPTYDTGNMMTDLLLGSELRGFVANPAHYFDDSDPDSRRHADLLMLVQGWRKYKWQELADTSVVLRYTPEQSMTVEGAVYKMVNIEDVEEEDIASLSNAVAKFGVASDEEEDEEDSDDDTSSDDDSDDDTSSDTETSETGSVIDAMLASGVNHGGLKHEVTVDAELIFNDEVLQGSQTTVDGGRFNIDIPPYYGDAILKLKAYNTGDSIKKSIASRKDKNVGVETAYPDFYVKRDLFFPRYCEKYSYYQTNAPEDYLILLSTNDDEESDLSMENDIHQLQSVSVKGKRRGKRAIDFTKPVYTADAYEMYNLITDYGLSFGMYIRRDFAYKIARFLYGNMGRTNKFNVDGRLDRYTYYRSYTPDENDANKAWDNRSNRELYVNTQLKRLDEIKVFSDYEPRNEYMPSELDTYNADVTVELINYPNDAVRPTFRDRHIILHGFNAGDDFYNPDYSNAQPAEPTDYRRTLYWNPNAVTDSNGQLHISFYNNSKDTRIKLSVAGITADGRIAVY